MSGLSRIGLGVALGAIATYCFVIVMKIHSSEIIVSDQMSDFVDAVDRSQMPRKNTLVVFDLDDTLFKSNQHLGTPAWFYHTINMVRRSGAAEYEAYRVASKIEKIVQEWVDVVAVEQTTLSAIKTWQKEGALVVALSSRSSGLANATAKQLEQIELNFDSPLFDCVLSGWGTDMGAFESGVMYVGDHATKSQVFEHFMKLSQGCGFDPKLIAVADDQQHYVRDLAKLSKNAMIDFIGVVYGGAFKGRHFDLRKANKQLIELEKNLQKEIIPKEYREVFEIEKNS